VFGLGLKDAINNQYQSNFTGFANIEDVNYENSISYLLENGILLASNVDSQKEIDFGVFLNTQSGLDFDAVELTFDKTTLNNSIITSTNEGNANKNLNKFKVFAVNPDVDTIELTLKYKGVNEYGISFVIPIIVREYPISLVVNKSTQTTYNVFDYYSGSDNGQAFNAIISKAGAFDKTYKVEISKNDFDLLEVRYQYEILDYETFTGLNFDNNSIFYIKAKTLDEPITGVKLTFISNVYSESYDNSNIVKEIDLNLNPGIRMLSYTETNNELYLESGKSIDINYLVNGLTNSELASFVQLNVIKGAELVQVTQDVINSKFTIKSLGETGKIEFKLYSENGLETESKFINIYNYDENAEDNMILDLSSNNIKKVVENSDTKYFVGLVTGKNTANFSVINPFNASIYDVKVESNNTDVVKVGIINSSKLNFYLTAVGKSVSAATITVTITLYNDNENVNSLVAGQVVTKTFNIETYWPIEKIDVLEDEIVLVDGAGLDIDSLNKQLNVLCVEDYLNIRKNDNDLSNIAVNYTMPASLRENDDYTLEDVIDSKFDKIKFAAGKNHVFNNGEYIFGFTVRIEDLPGSNEYHLVNLKVKLVKHVAPSGINILNDKGYYI